MIVGWGAIIYFVAWVFGLNRPLTAPFLIGGATLSLLLLLPL